MEEGKYGDTGGKDGDTQEFSEGELALFGERSRAQSDKNGDINSPWARLVSLDKNFSNIELSDYEVRLGRADFVKATGEEDMHVSKVHCKIWKNTESGLCHLQNLRYSTDVNMCTRREELRKDRKTGDETCGSRQSASYDSELKNNNQRVLQAEADSMSDVVKDQSSNGPDAKRAKIMESLDTFKCSICLNVWHDVISVTPCLHSFCNSCFSDWYRKSCRDRSECICPQCRGSVSSVSRNHTLRSLVEDLLTEEPSLGRSADDIFQMDKNSLFKGGSESLQFGKNRTLWMGVDVQNPYDASGLGDDAHNSETLSSDEDDDEEEVEEYGCFQCANQGGLFQCPSGQSHFECASCGRLYPERSDLQNVGQKCELCSRPYCRTYFESQHYTPVDYGRCPKIQPLSQRGVMDMPSRTHHGNPYEQEVTRRYIAEQGLSVQAVLRDWLGRLDSGEADHHPFVLLSQPRVNSLSAVCEFDGSFCADEVFAHLLDRFRSCVPKTELPPDAAGRADCWYGYDCRTQHHKEAHARKLNHVCEPSRPSNRRGSAVHL